MMEGGQKPIINDKDIINRQYKAFVMEMVFRRKNEVGDSPFCFSQLLVTFATDKSVQ